jgi:hypothetical protein
MKNCTQCEFKFNTTTGTPWNEFINQFEILSSNEHTSAGTGDAKCKKCGLEVNWEHEVYIHEKLYVSKKSEI